MAKTEYEESLKIFWDFSNVLSTAKREGEREEKIRNAQKMKAKGIDFADISDITGLTAEEIEEL